MTTIEINSIIVTKRIIKKYEEQYLSYCGAVLLWCCHNNLFIGCHAWLANTLC